MSPRKFKKAQKAEAAAYALTEKKLTRLSDACLTDLTTVVLTEVARRGGSGQTHIFTVKT